MRFVEAMVGVSRRRLLLSGAGAVSLAALPFRPARAADPITVRLDWSTHALHTAFFLAAAKGWFRQVDLDVTIEDGNGSATTANLVGNGQFDIGLAALAPMALGRAKGLKVISVAGFVRKSDTGFLVPRDSGWTKPKDLIGKKLVYTAGSLEGPFMAPFFKKNGIKLSDLDLLNVDASAKASMYATGKADSVVTAVPFFLPLMEDKRPSNGVLFADFGLNLPGAGLLVNTDILARRGDAIRRFTSVMCGAWSYVLGGHEQEGVEATLAARPQSPENAKVMRAELEEYRRYFYTDATKSLGIGPQSDADWNATIADMVDANTIAAGFKPSDFYTNEYIDPGVVRRISGIG